MYNIYKSLELPKMLFGIVKMFMFNDLEFINFTIFLDKLNWDNKNIDPEDFLFIVGLGVKLKLIDYNEFYYQKINRKHPDLVMKYNEWIEDNQNFDDIIVTERELNSKFKFLSRVFIFILFFLASRLFLQNKFN